MGQRDARVKRHHGQAGFTLLELLIVIAILGVLAAILIPNFIRSRSAAQLAAAQLDLRNIGAALDMYYNENQAYPAQAGWATYISLKTSISKDRSLSKFFPLPM